QAIEVNAGKASFFGTQYHPEYNLFEMARLIKARAQALVTEGFFTTTDQVLEYAKKMDQLHDNPESEELKTQLNIDGSVIDPEIKEQELRNWINYLNV
ncbi:MAG: type 1 glutamine amidotransferase, partial [Desulfobacula sp.]|nr:type 1 glutamine amidotransferase [Desulfobacula sp.]